MATNVEGHSIPDGSSGESITYYDRKLKRARENLLLYGSRFRSVPIDIYLRKFYHSANELDQANDGLMQCIVDDANATVEQKARAIQTIMQDCDMRRDEILNRALGQEKFKSENFKDDSVHEIIHSALTTDDYGDPVSFFGELLFSSNKEGYREFEATAYETRAATSIELAKQAGRYALDMSKIAVSVAVGVAIANKITKK